MVSISEFVVFYFFLNRAQIYFTKPQRELLY